MSEVKLWTLLSPTAKGEPFNIQPATDDEIKAGHPKCISCRYILTTKHGMGEGECGQCEESVTTWHCLKENNNHEITEPTKDYCRHHKPKGNTK